MYKKQPSHRVLTREQLLAKLTSLCARSEHCRHDMLEKMRAWDVDEALQSDVIGYLVRERYVDDERYARAFIRSKSEYNKWGRRKIEQALRLKHIDESTYLPLLDELCDGEECAETLSNLLRSKARTVKGATEYEVRCKLIRFALSRGFEYGMVEKVIDGI